MKGNYLYRRFGVRIIKVRRVRGLTQDILSTRSQVDRTFLGKIERGNANPSFRTMIKLSRALKVSLSELLEGV